MPPLAAPKESLALAELRRVNHLHRSLQGLMRCEHGLFHHRAGVAAKEVERALGVTYKTAWRMCRIIREYMGYVDGDHPIGGGGSIVEADKAFIGGADKKGQDDKKVVLRQSATARFA